MHGVVVVHGQGYRGERSVAAVLDVLPPLAAGHQEAGRGRDRGDPDADPHEGSVDHRQSPLAGHGTAPLSGRRGPGASTGYSATPFDDSGRATRVRPGRLRVAAARPETSFPMSKKSG